MAYSGGNEEKSHSYVQLYRNGIIEAVEGLLLEPSEGKLIIPSIAYEQKLINSLMQYLSHLKALTVEPPIFIFLTLLGVKGYSMSVDRFKFPTQRSHTIDRDILLLPEVIVESYDGKAEDVLRPCFDSIWNACGFPRSLNYDAEGNWVRR